LIVVCAPAIAVTTSVFIRENLTPGLATQLSTGTVIRYNPEKSGGIWRDREESGGIRRNPEESGGIWCKYKNSCPAGIPAKKL
jgi:hypothetical protein